ncbi:chymotrypsin family serine protease [Winogradskyella algicola]|uniref:hypothetical protein n=1 Tax=Winogradskyella algicola TaxID=2575815 RepID=UPI001108F9E4|nr:hypothetical protein [Winogradskyella algicola]
MTEEEANNRLTDRHEIYFASSKKRITRYAAVIKKSRNIYIKDDFLIELGYTNGQVTIEQNINKVNIKEDFIKSAIEQIDIEKSIIEEIENGLVQVELTNSIDFQNDQILYNYCGHDCVKCCKGLCEYVGEASTKKYCSLTGGISTYNAGKTGGSGTAGGFFTSTDSNHTYLLSNFHVLIGFKNEFNFRVTHPSRYNTYGNNSENFDVIGEVIWYKRILQKGFNLMDAAVAQIYPKIKIDYGKYTRSGLVEILGIGDPKIGEMVKKCGGTTGLTYGEIKSINCTINISNNEEYPMFFHNQLLTTLMTKPGDSGSILVNQNGFAVGLLFAGNNFTLSVANNIKYIFNHLRDEKNINFKKFV